MKLNSYHDRIFYNYNLTSNPIDKLYRDNSDN